jgi:bifunctional non-homologous end joining protein LigD
MNEEQAKSRIVIPGKRGGGKNVIVTALDADNIDQAIEETLAKKRGEGGPACELIEEDLTAQKPGPVVIKRKREGIALCKVFDPEKPPKWKQIIFEPKFDGYRCLARVANGVATLLTSTGLPHWNVDHIKQQLEDAVAIDGGFDNVVLDGEVMHISLDFDVAGGILRKHDPHPEANGFRFHVWDFLPLNEFDTKAETTQPLWQRKVALQQYCHDLNQALIVEDDLRLISPVDYAKGEIGQVEAFAREWIGEGYEGVVMKDADAVYNFGGKKGNCWLKWKPAFNGEEVKEMKDGDVRITGATPGRGKHQGRAGALCYQGYLQHDGNISPDPEPDGLNQEVTGKGGTGLSDAQREQFWAWQQEDTLAGRCAEIRYQELSSKGKLRFPVFYRLREDKD